MTTQTQKLGMITLLAALFINGGCGGSSSSGNSDGTEASLDNCPGTVSGNQTDPAAVDSCPATATTYTFASKITEGESSVSYTGQTARQVLISDLTGAIASLTDTAADVKGDLEFLVRGDVDTLNHGFALSGESVIPGPTYGDISTGKNLDGKIAGGNGAGGGETAHLLSEFIGWSDGLDDTPLPIELVDYYLDQIDQLATDGVEPTIATSSDSSVNVTTIYVDGIGRDYRQLVQKFLLGAVTFSQGTSDYLKTDFAANMAQDGDKPYTIAEHKWDEAFGYFGAARDYNDYSDDEIRASSGRAEYQNGYYDSNGDGIIDLRSEINLANSVNCAKRDAGSTVATDFTKTAFDAFLLGRETLNNASANGELTAAEVAIVTEQALIASQTWEKCIAATVIHYINDVIGDIENFDNGVFADLANYTDLAKHWSEMKGFALGLQFNPDSPFRSGTVANIGLTELEELLTAMGDSPVLANGFQGGVAPTGTAQEAIDNYVAGLEAARSTLQTAYDFSTENVENW